MRRVGDADTLCTYSSQENIRSKQCSGSNTLGNRPVDRRKIVGSARATGGQWLSLMLSICFFSFFSFV